MLFRSCRTAAAIVLLAAFGAAGRLAAQSPAADPSPAEQVDFVRDVWPIFSRNCLGCHGKAEQESGFRLDSREAALSSGDEHAPNLVPGQGGASNLIRFVTGQVDGMQMPPDGAPLAEDQVELLRRWIDQGAKWGDVQAEIGRAHV